MSENNVEVKKGFDLYVFRDGKWGIHENYLPKEQEQAESAAEKLKETGTYVSVCLVDHKTREIIFNHNTRGDRLTYAVLISGGQGYVPQSGDTIIRKAKTVDRSGPKSSMQRLTPLFIALISLLVGGFIAKNTSEHSLDLSHEQFILPISVVALGFVIALIIYLKQIKGDMSNEANEADTLERKWKNMDGILRESIYDFKKYCLDESGEMLNDSHFGIILMAIGIGEGCIKHNNLPKNDAEEKVQTFLDNEGIAASGVARVWSNIYEYLAYPRYKRMYDKGKNIAKTRVDNRSDDLKIKASVEEWLGQSVEREDDIEVKVASVLFTDIVDFTSSHQRHGDSWMVDVVKAHNEIVRTALSSFKGKEVKHTGDGIMASFPSALMATQAAQAMQKGFIKFTEAVPTRAFDVRIGISAGEPIHMGDDIFGTPVNLAARVMAEGNGRDIMLAQSAYEICKDADHSFDKVTGCKLKGFDGDHTLYRINCAHKKVKAKVREDIGETFMDKDDISFLK